MSQVIRFFERISQIPRESGNEQAISDFVANFAKQRGFSAVQDDMFNVIIKKPASKGYENAPSVILQGHLDMVCEKSKGAHHDFAKDPIRLKRIGDMMYAENTTLGADNGQAVAYALALLDTDDLEHPELEIVFTTEEETTMKGAENLDTALLNGRIMINLDSNREGVLFVSSAGGADAFHSVPIVWDPRRAETDQAYSIRVTGLLGGHSGDDIIHERANANKILGRVLDDLRRSADFDLAGIGGGLKANAIPREAGAVIFLNGGRSAILHDKIAECKDTLRQEYYDTDPDISVELIPCENRASPDRCFSKASRDLVIDALSLIPTVFSA